MEFFSFLDAPILAFFTMVSHRFQWLTGKTNFFLAKIMIMWVAAGVIVEIGNYWFPVLGRATDTFDLVIHAIFLFFTVTYAIDCDSAENLSNKTPRIKFYFGPIISSPVFRILALGVSVLGLTIWNFFAIGIFIFKLVELGVPVGFVAFIYFVSVDPLPPGRSKVQELKENFVFGLKRMVLLPTKK